MNCNVHVLYKIIFSNKFGFILETVFSYKISEMNYQSDFLHKSLFFLFKGASMSGGRSFVPRQTDIFKCRQMGR